MSQLNIVPMFCLFFLFQICDIPFCTKRYKHRSALARHIKNDHGIPEGMKYDERACVWCGVVKVLVPSKDFCKACDMKMRECARCGIQKRLTQSYTISDNVCDQCSRIEIQRGAGSRRVPTTPTHSAEIPQKSPNSVSPPTPPSVGVQVHHALDNSLSSYRIFPQPEDSEDVTLFSHHERTTVNRFLKEELTKKRGLKVIFSLNLDLVKVSGGKDGAVVLERTSPHLTTTPFVIVGEDDISEVIDQGISDILTRLEDYEGEKSGWCVDKIHHLDVRISPYQPLAGAAYIPTPPQLMGKNALVSIQNSDNKCFLWSILGYLHPVTSNKFRVSKYLGFEHELDMNGISIPFISKICRNSRIKIVYL